jgi:Kef-type K+ transport system membrane component KefB
MLILLGVIVGPSVLDLLPGDVAGMNEIYTPTALTMVAFLLGGSLKRETLQKHGREIILISIVIVITSVVVIGGGLYLIGVSLPFALILGGISAATDPAATRDVIKQSGSKGRFATNLLGIVAIDDAWGVLAFSVVLTFASILSGGDIYGHLLHGMIEIGGAVALGLAIGLPAAYLTGRIKRGEPTLMEALGIVFLCAGLAIYFEFSFLLTGMVAGAVVVNLAKHHEQPFHEIERIEWPFMLLFFVIAGASFQPKHLTTLGLVGVAYVGLRILSRLMGGWIGGRLAGLPERESRLTGLALMPQAGVAIGMALVASERFPEISEGIVAITIASTIIFELIGPIMTQIALSRVRD